MLKQVLLALILAFSTIITGTVIIQSGRPTPSSPIAGEMPIVPNGAFVHLAHGGTPIEQRDDQYRKWLSVELKIQVSNASGSGTIIFYDEESGYAYVQSCGHLWSGTMSAEEGRRRKLTCKVVSWYENLTKRPEPREYPAEVLFYSNVSGQDCSLMRFKPDWKPNYLPIAPASYQYQKGDYLHSVGCDGGREVAHYKVRVIGFSNTSQFPDLVTTENSPRPGRSGGGLLTDDYYVGICWGTSIGSGDGNGYFTPLTTLRALNKQNGYAWLNDVDWARMIPVIDRNGPQKKYDRTYIPLPGER